MSNLYAKTLADKKIIGIDGSQIGTLYNLIIDLRTGDIIDLVVRPDIGVKTEQFRSEDNLILLPFSSVRAIKNYIVIDKKSATVYST